jgi:hypothetical protein
MATYYVYFGYVGPDHHDAPTYVLKEFRSKEDVFKHHKEFMESMHEECGNIIYRVIAGNELRLVPVEKVVEYQFASDDDDE